MLTKIIMGSAYGPASTSCKGSSIIHTSYCLWTAILAFPEVAPGQEVPSQSWMHVLSTALSPVLFLLWLSKLWHHCDASACICTNIMWACAICFAVDLELLAESLPTDEVTARVPWAQLLPPTILVSKATTIAKSRAHITRPCPAAQTAWNATGRYDVNTSYIAFA